MLPLDPKSPAARVEGTLVQEPTLVTTGDRWLPHPYGHVRHRGADLLVHSVKGPAGAFTGVPHPLKAHGGILIPHDAGGVRALTDGEVLACQGVYPQALPEQITADHCTLMKLAVLGPGWQAAGAVLGLLDVPLKESGKIGSCLDPDELLADQQLQIWLEAWTRNKENPRQELDLVPASWEPPTPLPSAWTDTERCGGTPRKPPAHHAPRGVRISPTSTIRHRKPFCQSLPIQHGNLTAPAGSNGSSSWLLRAVTHFSAERHEQNVSRTNNGLFVSSSSCIREWGAPPKESDRGCQASGTPISLQAFLTPYRVELGSGLLYRVSTDGTGLRCGRSP